VVASYRPAGEDVASELARVRAIASHTASGERFDSLAIDLTVADPADSKGVDRLVELSRQLRAATGDGVLAAIVHSGVPRSAELAALYDVWVLATGKAPADEVAALRAVVGE
jgi:ABC-type transporter Mla MlaB component